MRARVRGIYATAGTARLRGAGHAVVQASPPIRERFDGEFPTAAADVSVETTSDRQGVCVTGGADSVADAVEALRGFDTFVWAAALPQDAVFDGVVTRTTRGGAIVDVGVGEGYLPFDNADGHVEEDDAVRVQVAEPKPPWADDRAVLDTELRLTGSLGGLVRGRDAAVASTPPGDSELAQLTEMLPAGVPDGWAVEWGYAAADASMDDLNDALADLAEAATELDAALAGTLDPTAEVASPAATTWCWFGRATRDAFDETRREVVATMPGHHRVKAADRAASAAVDFAEGVGVDAEAFPFEAVSDAFGPREDDRVAIQHGKPDGRLLVLGRGDVTSLDADASRITVKRSMTAGGSYDALGVPRSEGDVAVTRFVEGRWWYPTVYRDADGGVKGTYVNVNTPLELFPDAVRYVDLHVDVLKHADGRVEVVDEDELEASVEAGEMPRALADEALDVAETLADRLG
ncbi:DUF402 domain-containing protein [Halocalculus aciditolerans]|uniref:Probable ribonuclease FAU-1 n=1 Tax=Halocalculus aciditolerans TaxID=1383812 RepID=A0A830FFP4_9EURY|nr:DUF402 domain-containing protein [Halocalculus aciditolerans]GGL70009.1 RNA-binding protein [Halocalculus aciditolerans]